MKFMPRNDGLPGIVSDILAQLEKVPGTCGSRLYCVRDLSCALLF